MRRLHEPRESRGYFGFRRLRSEGELSKFAVEFEQFQRK